MSDSTGNLGRLVAVYGICARVFTARGIYRRPFIHVFPGDDVHVLYTAVGRLFFARDCLSGTLSNHDDLLVFAAAECRPGFREWS